MIGAKTYYNRQEAVFVYRYVYMKQIRAFSLVELMVVIAIISILAAVAVPSYKDYVTRSRLTSGMVILDTLKTLATEYYSINGSFPTLDDLNKTSTGFATESVSWGDMGPDGWTGGDAVSAYVEVQYNSDTVPGQTAPRLAFVATVNGNSVHWDCYTYSAANVDSSISTKFLPPTCEQHP
jgi:type IV pilus assembly protein PilA